jgi:hypothetical protein
MTTITENIFSKIFSYLEYILKEQADLLWQNGLQLLA